MITMEEANKINGEIPEQKTEQIRVNDNITVITSAQWEQIKPKVVISSYGIDVTFFKSIDDMKKALKIVTLNGSPIRQITKKGTSMYERAKPNIVKLPNGSFAVLSDTLRNEVGFMGKSKVQSLPNGL